jgi:hypothetical protein
MACSSISTDSRRQILARRIGLRQAIVLNPTGIALVPLGRSQGLQPGRRHHRHFVQGRAQGLPDALKTVQTTDSGQHMRGVRPLTATRLDQIAQALQQGIKQLLFGLSFHQAGSEFTQHRMIKTGVSQREPQSVLPIDPSAHGIGSLTIGQAFHVLQARASIAGAAAGWPTWANRAANWLSW